MRACNNNNTCMVQPLPTCFISMGLCMLLLLHALISCIAAYILHVLLSDFWYALSSLQHSIEQSVEIKCAYMGHVFTNLEICVYTFQLVPVLQRFQIVQLAQVP